MGIEELKEVLLRSKFLWLEQNAVIEFTSSPNTICKNGNIWATYTINANLTNPGTFTLVTNIFSEEPIWNLTVLISKNPQQVVQFNFDLKRQPQINQHWEIMDK